MAKKRITEDQVKKILQEVANGAKPPVLAKKYGFSLGTFYNWKNKIGIPKSDGSAPAKKAPAAKKPAAKKAVAAKKPAAKKAVAAKKPVAKKAVAKKAPAKKVAAKKPAVKKAVAAKKPVAKKVVAKKAVARKAPVRKAPVRKAAPRRATASAESKLQAEIAKRQKQIATIEGQITRLKVRYAEAILKSVK